ncbi:hypothetical protein BDD12DRAFT_261690 [Trichophaea hybrida]|nr:hypothetical protein BDD12DRAFT_261690 [Trichophaea hybrida]
MDFYNIPASRNIYIIDRTRWFSIPQNSTIPVSRLVVSVSQSESRIWVVTYTILVGFVFAAMTRLMAGLVLAYFTLGSSGTRHAMLVAFINTVNSPTTAAKVMFDYFTQSLFSSQRKGKRATDWSALRGSLILFGMTGAMVSGGIITKYLLGGTRLVLFNSASVNPAAIFYPIGIGNYDARTLTGITPEAFRSLKRVRNAAIYQAIGRQEAVKGRLDKRVTVNTTKTFGNHGMEIRFEYHYNLTGFEMGIRDAPQLLYAVSGHCNTAYDGVAQSDNASLANSTKTLVDRYPYFGNTTDANAVVLLEDQFTAPFASVDTDIDPAGLENNKRYGGYRFSITPHTAYRFSKSPNDNDPWYQTEKNPNIGKIWPQSYPYRVKRSRPPLHCTQNDTYSHGGVTVNYITKLDTLPKLKMSFFLSNLVFNREFGSPVFLLLTSNANYAALESSAYFDANQRGFDAQYASIDADLKRLAYTAFIYSREVVRNTVLLYPTLNNEGLKNVAQNGTDKVPDKFADIFLDSPEVAAMDVRVMVATPSVMIILWILVFVWSKMTSSTVCITNHDSQSLHIMRGTALKAVQLYRYLDEEISGTRRWSGRLSETPYIRDLDSEEECGSNAHGDAKTPLLEKQEVSKGGIEVSSMEKEVGFGDLPASTQPQPVERNLEAGINNQPKNNKHSRYIRPKVVLKEKVPPDERKPGWFDRLIWGPIKCLFGRKLEPPGQRKFELIMTQDCIKDPTNPNSDGASPEEGGTGNTHPKNTTSKNDNAIHWKDLRKNV